MAKTTHNSKATSRRYRAFISYSHGTDRTLAPLLQSALMRYSKPWYRLQAFAVFRDETDLSASPGLWSSIEKALEESDYFILLASPEAAKSEWVQKEISWWLQHRGSDTLLIALTDGELCWDNSAGDFDSAASTSVPPPLKGVFEEVPKHVDFRWTRESDVKLSRRNTRFASDILTLAATLHGVSKSVLASVEQREHRRALVLAWTAVGIIIFAGVLAAVLARVASQQRDAAERNFLTALSRQLGAQATTLSRSQYDLALLLAAQATQIQDQLGSYGSQEAYGSVLTLLGAHPRLRAYLHPEKTAVSPIALSPDGTTMVYTLAPDRLALFDLTNRRVTRRSALNGVEGIEVMAFTPDGRQLAIGDAAGRLHLWDIASNAVTRTFMDSEQDNPKRVTDIAISQDGNRIAVAHKGDAAIRLWLRHEPGRVTRIEPAHNGEVTGIAFGRGAVLGSAGGDGRIRLWDTAGTGSERLSQLPIKYGTAWAVAFSPDGKLLATGGAHGDTLVNVWNVADPKNPRAIGLPINKHQSAVLEVAFDSTGSRFVSGDRAGQLVLWNAHTGQPLNQPLSVHRGAVHSIQFAAPQDLMLTSSRGHDAWIHSHAFDAQSNEILLWDLSVNHRLAKTSELPEKISGLSSSLEQAVLASGGQLDRGTIQGSLHRAKAGVPLIRKNYSGSAAGIAFSPSGRVMAFDQCVRREQGLCTESSLFFWNIDTATQLAQLQSVDTRVYSSFGYSPDSRLFAAGDLDGRVELWDVTNPARPILQYGPIQVDQHGITSIVFDKAGELLVCGASRGALRVFDIRDPRNPIPAARSPEMHRNLVSDLVFHPNHRVLASSSYDQRVMLWDLSRFPEVQLLDVLKGPSEMLHSIDIHPDGNIVAAGSTDGRIWIWDYKSRRLLSPPLRLSKSHIEPIRFSSDGSTLVSVGNQPLKGTELTLWNMDLSNWRDQACAIAGRLLTDAEWQRYLGIEDGKQFCDREG